MVDKTRLPPEDRSNPPDELEFIFRSSFVTKDGRRIFAKDYGLKAFRFPRRY